MAREARYDILFEPVRIGPLEARNRFYQTPHCNGMGGVRPNTLAAMRGVKAEGGWAVVNTEHVSIHPTDDLLPEPDLVLWDDDDIPALANMADAIHEHGALAGIQLGNIAYYNANRMTREVPLAPTSRPPDSLDPVQARAMDKADIRTFMGWQKAAARRAVQAGFDIVNVDAKWYSLGFQFLSPKNRRTDEYGGSLANRVRFIREMLEVTREAVGPDIAVTIRMVIDELMGTGGLSVEGEGGEAIGLLAELPDLWDVVAGPFRHDARTSRFAPEAAHEAHVALVKGLTTKPVVGVGRFTSPDTMASQIERGILDMIGSTRPSIADPFLPRKIEAGRIEDIRECIGCNICLSGQHSGTPSRCTQNPTMGEEWRKGWHPERIAAKGSDDTVLVTGAGPAGLECARALGQRGYEVHLAEAGKALGGRVARECRLPGLAEWGRVRDYRLAQIEKLAHVRVYPGSRLDAEDVRELGFGHVVVATGATWRRDGTGRCNIDPIPVEAGAAVLTPDDVMDGAVPDGTVIVFDDDHYYMGGVIAEKLRGDGLAVTLVTPAAEAAAWTHATLEIDHILSRLAALEVEILPYRNLAHIRKDEVALAHLHAEQQESRPAASVVLVTARAPSDALYHALSADPDALATAGIKSVTRIGDCHAPGTIAAAVYAGHRYARELDTAVPTIPFLRERLVLHPSPGPTTRG